MSQVITKSAQYFSSLKKKKKGESASVLIDMPELGV